MALFQYISDIHTEMYTHVRHKVKNFHIEVKAPYLLLAGDIGNPFTSTYIDFLELVAPKFQQVFVISGNHEYYQLKSLKSLYYPSVQEDWINKVDEQILFLTASFPNVRFLQNDYYHLSDSNLTVFGGTFWTNILENEELDVKYCISDYRFIPNFTVQQSRELHKKSCSALKKALDDNPSRDFVVMSHHLPSYKLIHEKYKNLKTEINSAFASEIELANHPRIKAWVAGHTHTPMQIEKFYVNPIGYINENKDANFNRYFQIHP